AFVVAIGVSLFLNNREPVAEQTLPRLVTKPDVEQAPGTPAAEPNGVAADVADDPDEPFAPDDDANPLPTPPAPVAKPVPPSAPAAGTAEAPEPAAPVAVEPAPVVRIGGPTPAPVMVQPDVLPVRERPRGLLVLTTVPPVKEVLKNNRPLPKTGLGYELDVGDHMVTAVSPDGERYRFPVKISAANDKFMVCYNFSTNSRCSGQSD
ncbi:MAG: hypothetical protein AAF211_10385, partial [Myxococcota bacterium]